MKIHAMRSALAGVIIVVTAVSLYRWHTAGDSKPREAAPFAVQTADPQLGLRGRASVTAKKGSNSDSKAHGNAASLSAGEWATRFRQSRDYAAFIAQALKAAYAGNGRAAYYVGKALLSCELIVRKYRASPDPDGQFQTETVSQPTAAPQWMRDREADEFHRCVGLIKAEPFAQLPARVGGYSYSYWLDQAVVDGDPVAVIDRTNRDIANIAAQASAEGKDTAIRHVQDNIRAAVESRDPNAIFLAGIMLTNGQYSKDPLSGVAISLAACDLGYDCSADNPENPFATCRASGACPAEADFAYYVQRSLGPEQYAQAYSKAQEFEAMLTQNDTRGVNALTQLKSQN